MDQTPAVGTAEEEEERGGGGGGGKRGGKGGGKGGGEKEEGEETSQHCIPTAPLGIQLKDSSVGVNMYVHYMYVCTCTYACMYVCTYVRMYSCMHVSLWLFSPHVLYCTD